MLDNFVISYPFHVLFFRLDATFNNLPSLKNSGVQHVQREQYRCFNFEWVWSSFQILTSESSNSMLSAFCKATALKYKSRRSYTTIIQSGPKVSLHTLGLIAPPCFIFEGCCFADSILYLLVRGFRRQNLKIRIS